MPVDMPMTNHPSEWLKVGDNLWKHKRNQEAFSEDAGMTYYLLSECSNGEKKLRTPDMHD